MADEVSVGFYTPSYKRPRNTTTKDLIPFTTYVVRASEEAEYRKAGIERIIAVEDSLIDCNTKARQWIIDNTPEPIIVMTDDDELKCVYRILNVVDMSQDEMFDEIYRLAQIMYDLGIGYGGFAQNLGPFNYHDEFQFNKIIGAFFIVNKEVYKAEMDLEANWNEDTDRTLQELLLNRIVLQMNYVCHVHLMDTNTGGDSFQKDTRKLAKVHEYMKRKWGKHYNWIPETNTIRLKVKR